MKKNVMYHNIDYELLLRIKKIKKTTFFLENNYKTRTLKIQIWISSNTKRIYVSFYYNLKNRY